MKLTAGLFGRKKNLKTDVLPSKLDILRFYLWINVNGNQSSFPIIVEKVMEIWSSAGIPTVTKRMVTKCLKNLHKKYRKFTMHHKERKKSTSFQKKLAKFKVELKYLFDIAQCKCHESNCVKHNLSKNKRQFLINQRTLKKLKISIKDATAVSDYEQDEEEYVSEDESKFDENGNDQTYVVPTKKCRLAYNTLKLRQVALVADRYKASHTMTAAIATAVLEVVGLVTPENNALVIDKRKVARSRDKIRDSLDSQADEDFLGLYFDGRKDMTLFVEKEDDGIVRKSFGKEEHVSLIGQPGNKFLEYVPLDHGTALDFLTGITNVIDQDFDAMGCDGTGVNTGWKNGVIRRYEKYLQHSLQWLICL